MMLKTYTCKNGLRIVLEQVPHVRSATIGIWVLAGSRNETETTNGITHFLEHMLFKGTETRTAQQIAEEFDSIGGHVNAFTAKEYTCYYARVLDSHVERALDVLTDMFFNSTFLEEELEREKKVVLEEISMYEDTPDDLIHDLIAEAAFENHSLGRPILGTEKQLTSFTRDSLFDYMDTHYVPQHIVVSVAGNVDEQIIEKIEAVFSQKEAKNIERTYTAPQFTAKEITRTKETEQAHLCLAYPGVAIGDETYTTMLLINSVLGGGMSSRLFQEVREKRGLAYSIFSYHTGYLDSGLLRIYGGTNKDQVDVLLEAIEESITDLVQNGLTEKELTNSKEKLKGNILLNLESTNSRMSRNGKNELLLNKQRTLDDIIKEIDAVDQAMIQRVLEQSLQVKPAKALISPQ